MKQLSIVFLVLFSLISTVRASSPDPLLSPLSAEESARAAQCFDYVGDMSQDWTGFDRWMTKAGSDKNGRGVWYKEAPLFVVGIPGVIIDRVATGTKQRKSKKYFSKSDYNSEKYVTSVHVQEIQGMTNDYAERFYDEVFSTNYEDDKNGLLRSASIEEKLNLTKRAFANYVCRFSKKGNPNGIKSDAKKQIRLHSQNLWTVLKPQQ